jgi:ATP phosphoribosyltransferase regulatory subunit
MPAATPRSADLIGEFQNAGYLRVTPPILQPAHLFLDLSGEDLRRRMYLTVDAEGRELCLRPDLTIPTARLHLDRAAGAQGRYCYLGAVFRHGAGDGEALQAGIEIFGQEDREAAEAEVLGQAVRTMSLYGLRDPDIRLGDRALLGAFIDELDIPLPWRRRLMRDASRGARLDADLDALGQASNGNGDHAGFLAALDGADPKAAKAVVEDLLSIAGISQVGGRTAGDIAERFLEQARLRASASLPPATHEALRRFLAISGDPVRALGEIRSLIVEARLSGALSTADEAGRLRPALDAFERRLELLAERGIDVAAMRFDAAFGRQLDYYTGFVFEVRRAGADGSEEPAIGGGRYDDLLATLGAASRIPAVGCAIWVDRLEGMVR